MDTIGDFLTRVRNAAAAKHEKVDVPSSNMRVGIAKILQENGYIRDFKVAKDHRQGVMRVYLKYDQTGKPVFTNVRRISKPSARSYIKADDIRPVRSGFGISILSTNKGILSDETARKENVGGEILCEIW
ncbi:MAG: 30S ribosomal protein S8 [Bdellovibrionales bacterium]|nr:30S ribosomal protein S8 [Bdellovibrionales bacterium]